MMVIWSILILAVVMLAHEDAHRRAYLQTGMAKHKRDRLVMIRKVFETLPLKAPKLPQVRTLAYWRMPPEASSSTWFRVGLAGVLRGFVISIVVFTGLAFLGMPTVFNNQAILDGDKTILRDEVRVIDVTEKTSQQRVGSRVQPGDVVATIGTESIRDQAHLEELMLHFAETTTTVEIVRGQETYNVEIAFDSNGTSAFMMRHTEVNRYGLTAPIIGLATTAQLAYFSVGWIWSEGADMSEGLELLMASNHLGYAFLFFTLGYLSIVYSLLNLIPIKPFDMGRVLESIRNKPGVESTKRD